MGFLAASSPLQSLFYVGCFRCISHGFNPFLWVSHLPQTLDLTLTYFLPATLNLILTYTLTVNLPLFTPANLALILPQFLAVTLWSFSPLKESTGTKSGEVLLLIGGDSPPISHIFEP